VLAAASAVSAANGACLADHADAFLEVLACYVKHDYKELNGDTGIRCYLLTYLLVGPLPGTSTRLTLVAQQYFCQSMQLTRLPLNKH